MFYAFLFTAFYVCIRSNIDSLQALTSFQNIGCEENKVVRLNTPSGNSLDNADRTKTVERLNTPSGNSFENTDRTKTQIEINGNGKYQNPYTSSGSDALSFYNDLELIKKIGAGDVSYAFKARYKNKTVVAKIATDSDLYYSDLEIDFFRELKKPPSISNIPELYYSIRSMPNPFFAGNTTYLRNDLGISSGGAKSLITKRRISVIAMDLLKGKRESEDLNEVRRLMKSMLETMQFVHSRNIMHCDLHGNNYYWDGKKVHFFDWNAAFWYEPNNVPIHYNRAPKHLFPPEAQKNTSAVHTSVYAFDVYTIGRLMKMLLEDCCGITWKSLQKSRGKNISKAKTSALLDKALAYEMAEYMMIPNPYKRPDTTAALKHPFLKKLMTEEQ